MRKQDMQNWTEIATSLFLSFLKLYLYATQSDSSLCSSPKLFSYQSIMQAKTKNWEQLEVKLA